MDKKKTKEATYTKDQIGSLVAEVLAEVTVELKDPSLVIAGAYVMTLLGKKLK